MSIFIDRKYLHLVSPKLLRFSKKKDDLYNFRCPFCGDSSTNKLKCRGFIYRKKNDYFFRCHNCNLGHTMYNFLEFVDPNVCKQYALERFSNGEDRNQNYEKPKFDIPKPQFKKKLIDLPTIKSLPADNIAKIYVESRKIPLEKQNNLYYCTNFKEFCTKFSVPEEKLHNLPEDDRLIIPFVDSHDNLIAFQGRDLHDGKIRYITIKLMEESPKIFGLNTVNMRNMVYVVEGPIDSLFVDNSIATADSNLSFAETVVNKNNMVLVFDNEPRNISLVKIIEKSIKNDFTVALWPQSISEKDINDMFISGKTKSEIKSIIDSNTFSGLRAKLEFNNWRKV